MASGIALNPALRCEICAHETACFFVPYVATPVLLPTYPAICKLLSRLSLVVSHSVEAPYKLVHQTV